MEVGGRSSSSDHGHGGGMNMGEGFSSMRMNMMMPPPPPPLMPSPPPLPNNNPPYCLEMNTLFPPPPPLSSSSNNNNNMAFYNDNKNRIKQNPQVAAPGNCYFMMINNNNTTTTTSTSDQNNNNNNDSCSLLMRAKIMAHPHYPRLLAAYINCHKVGAPPEVVKRLDEILSADKVNRSRSSSTGGGGGVLLGEDPSLDQFMEAYSEMLIKYEQQLTKPLQEAMLFLSSLHSQLKTLDTPLTNSPPPPPPHSSSGQNGSSDGEIDANNNDNYIDPQAEDRELKLQLLRKYSGCLGSLKQEFMKKRKKGKLPKEAREQLLDWWSRHYKWPYPSESQKMALAETTGLDQKQINNWFINQRKRHWKPSEEMQFVELDGSNHPHHQYYIENVLNNNPYYMDYYTQPSLL